MNVSVIVGGTNLMDNIIKTPEQRIEEYIDDALEHNKQLHKFSKVYYINAFKELLLNVDPNDIVGMLEAYEEHKEDVHSLHYLRAIIKNKKVEILKEINKERYSQGGIPTKTP